jgi:patatin-like phospholipase/acyl hydrolase
MKKILSIDGGGMRGLISVLVLKEIEKKTNKNIGDMFDLITGTSTGGMITLGLTVTNNGKVQYNCDNIKKMYIDDGTTIFQKNPFSLFGLLRPKYSKKGLKDISEKYFNHKLLKNTSTRVMINTFDIKKMQPVLFRSYKHKFKNIPMKTILRATTAAPTFFEPVKYNNKVLIDGGVFANNPLLIGLIEAQKLFNNEEILFISLGNSLTMEKYNYNNSSKWGLIEWIDPIKDVLLDSTIKTDNYISTKLFNNMNGQFYRLNNISNKNYPMDDTSNENINNLIEIGKKIIKNNKNKINEICDKLI